MTTSNTAPAATAAVPCDEAPELVSTLEHRRFGEFADAVRADRYIGLCYGAPGVGKTISARSYADWQHVRPLLGKDNWLHQGTARPDWHTIFYTPLVNASPIRINKELNTLATRHALLRAESVIDFGTGRQPHGASIHTELLVVDEADRLAYRALEQVRDFYDRSHLGLILIGMPGLEKRLARYPQLYSRIGFVHHYRNLNPTELARVVAGWPDLGLNASDPATVETIAAITRTTSGNFRLVTRLLAQAQRIAAINNLDRLTVEVIDAARDALVIGTA
ncbi:AAA family ATPase [Pseudonocardia nigra]|uniref:AAA family ATPase n=1 Tax=Pseudonocardia nigra TaxID=1921578 RepID=UPI001C602762|nr:AAA family ATPase [Pseudonocardia nigra]